METKDRPNATAIKALKEKLKALAAKQRPLKLLRKTTLPDERRAALLVETGMESWKGLDAGDLSYKAWSLVGGRRVEITAVLNLYHELRGSAHRHGVDDQDSYYYEKKLAELRKELAG